MTEPSEQSIQKLLSEKTPRELAIGYLRASARARDAEHGLKIMGGVADIQNEVLRAANEYMSRDAGDPAGGLYKALRQGKRSAK